MKVFSRRFVVLVLFLFIVDLNHAAVAAAEDLPQESVVMDEVVVTATKTPEKRKDIPNAVIVIDQKDIQASGAQSIGELLANEPGIDWRTYGNYGGASQEIQIRGMKGNATQVLVNGVNVASPSLGVANVGKIPIDNIERIEIVKGSGSLLYGSGAMAGTVNIITKSPSKDQMDLKVGVGYGSQDTYRLAAENGMFVAGDFGYYLTAGRTETDGFRDNSWLRQNDASLKLIFDKGDSFQAGLYGDYIDRTYGMPGAKPPAGTEDYEINGEKFYNSDAAALLDHSRDRDGHAVLEVKGRPVQEVGFALKGYYADMENDNVERYAYDGSGYENTVTNRVLGTDGHVAIYPFEGAKLLAGGEYKNLDWKNEGYDLDSDGDKTVKTTTEARIFTRSAFTEAEYRPLNYGKILAGIRHENHSVFGSENLPLFGLVLNPFEKTAVKISHGKHFLAPTPNDLYWPDNGYTRGNPDLKPEIGWHTDVTVEQSLLHDKLFMTLSYFHWNVDDKIQWEPDSQGVWSPMNLAGYKADGVEAGMKIGPFYDLTLAFCYTYTNAEEESRAYTVQDYSSMDFQYKMVKRRASMTPENQFKADLTYKSSFGLTATATVRYVDDRVMYHTETTAYPETETVTYTLDSYWTADLKFQQRLFRQWILSLSVYNLFDEAYDTHLASFTDQTTYNTVLCGYPGAGRSVFAGVAYEF